MEGDDAIPVIGLHRGVPLEDHQSPERLGVVRAEIDHALSMTDAVAPAEWAGDSWHSPESRQLACAMVLSMWTVATERREPRPDIDPERVEASTAGLGSQRWRDPDRYCSLLDPGGMERERPLD